MKNKTRREFLGNLDLQMNLMVKGGFGDEACGKCWGGTGWRIKKDSIAVKNYILAKNN